jgi:flagellar basal-body rod protein FlgG
MKRLVLLILFVPLTSSAMMRALNTAATGMQAQEVLVNTISNNIANINTTGFKKERAEFEDLLYQTVRESGGRSSANTLYNVGYQVGSGSRVSAIRREFSEGSPQMTNNPFDWMVKGAGFFGIMLPDGRIGYTRDGSFNVDQTGTLVNKTGYKVFPGLQFPPNTLSVNISEKGNVDAYIANQTDALTVGQVPVFTFINQVGLKAASGNIYIETQSSGNAIQNIPGVNGSGVVMQGTLETSNVSIMTEMTDLIRAQRAYEMNSKVMGVADQMLQTVNAIR